MTKYQLYKESLRFVVFFKQSKEDQTAEGSRWISTRAPALQNVQVLKSFISWTNILRKGH